MNLYFGLEAALDMMQKEGLDSIFARHARHRAAAQAGMKAMGLPLFCRRGLRQARPSPQWPPKASMPNSCAKP